MRQLATRLAQEEPPRDDVIRGDAKAPALTIYGVLVRRKVGPFNIRREFVAPSADTGEEISAGDRMAVFDNAP